MFWDDSGRGRRRNSHEQIFPEENVMRERANAKLQETRENKQRQAREVVQRMNIVERFRSLIQGSPIATGSIAPKHVRVKAKPYENKDEALHFLG